MQTQAVRRDDAVVEDEFDVGLGGKAAQRGGVVLQDCGFDSGDAEVFVAPGEVCAGGGDVGFGIAGDGRVAIENEVAVRCDAASRIGRASPPAMDDKPASPCDL